MITVDDLLQKIDISPKLIYFINNQYKKMIGQVRYSLGMLNGITKMEIARLFSILEISPSDLDDIMNQYPENVYVMKQPIYNILTLIMIKAYQIGNTQLALDTNSLLGLVFLGRLKYKYIRIINHDVLDKTIATLTKKTYIGMHGTVWMVNTICQNTYDKWIGDILKDPNDMYPRYRYIIDMRNKFNQVMKTVARAYYYNIVHKNDVDVATVIRNKTNEIIEYITTKSIPMNIIEYAGMVNSSSVDKINELNHDIQVYNSMQSQLSVIVFNILHRLHNYMTIYKEQYGKNVDINDITFIRSFFVALKRSTIILKSVDDEVFTSRGYDRFEVLSYALVVTLYIDSINHSSDYAQDYDGTASNSKQPEKIDYSSNYDYMNGNNDSTYEESIDPIEYIMAGGEMIYS